MKTRRPPGGPAPISPLSEKPTEMGVRVSSSSPFRVTPFGVFVGAFLLLLGAVVAIAIAQFWAKPLATWISICYSGGAVLCTVVAIVMRPRL